LEGLPFVCSSFWDPSKIFLSFNWLVVFKSKPNGHYRQISDLKRAFGSKSMPANWPKSFPKVPVQHVLNAGTLIPMCDLYSSMGNPKTCISKLQKFGGKEALVFVVLLRNYGV